MRQAKSVLTNRERQSPHILLAIEPFASLQAVRGVLDYAGSVGWGSISSVPWVLAESGKFPKERVDGAVVMIRTAQMQRAVKQLRCPVVNVSTALDDPGWPSVLTDGEAIGRLAARHLLDRGIRRFAAVVDGFSYSDARLRGFRQQVAAEGGTVSDQDVIPLSAIQQNAADQLLQKLPTPTGIFAVNDSAAVDLLRVCSRLHINVPGDLAVIGCDNNPFYTDQCRPTLTTISLPAYEVGYEACKILHRLLEGDSAVASRTLVPSVSVVTRESTEITFVADPQITQALQLLRTDRGMRMNVEELAEQLSTTRRTLERNFRKLVGRTPGEEIRRLRIERAKNLLSYTADSIQEIAEHVGFTNRTHLSSLFTSVVGLSPAAYRSIHAVDRQVVRRQPTG